MTQTPVEKPPKKSRWRRFLRGSFRTLIVLVVFGLALYAFASYWTARTIRNEIARIRAAGEPVTFADLAAMNAKPDPVQDAGPDYQAAAILAAAVPAVSEASHKAIFDPDKIPAVSATDDAQRLVDQSATALDLLDRAATLPQCSADLGIENGESLALGNAGHFRALSNTASIRTRLLLSQHKGEAAVTAVASSLPLLRVFDRQPILISALLEDAILAQNCRDVAMLLERGHLSELSLGKLAAALANAHPADPHRIFLTERVYMIEISRGVLLPDYQPDPTAPDVLPLPESWSRGNGGLFARLFAADSLILHGRLVASCSGDWPHSLDALNDIAAHPGSGWTPSSIISHILAPSAARAMLTASQTTAIWQSTQSAIQIERYRLAHAGALPDSLSNLSEAAAFAGDPFTNKPLLYTKTPDGYCIYSAGYHPPADRDKNPIDWSRKWGIHIRTLPLQ